MLVVNYELIIKALHLWGFFMYKKYELGSTVTQADLMNKLAKAFGQKI